MNSFYFLFLFLSFVCSPSFLHGNENIEIESDTFNLIADVTFEEPTQITPVGIKSLFNTHDLSTSDELTQREGCGSCGIAPPFSIPPGRRPPPPYPPVPPHLVPQQRPAFSFEAPQIPEMIHPKRVKKEKGTCSGYILNYENIPVIELLRIISEISNTNFIFDSHDLNFSISIVSEESSDVQELVASLLQILRMHGLSVVEQGKNVLIYKNESLSKVAKVITDDNYEEAEDAAVVTRVFRLYNLQPSEVEKIVRPLLSKQAVVEVSMETRHLIVSDITANIDKIGDLIIALDTPNIAFDIAQYQVKSAYPNALIAYAKEILFPLSQSNPIQMIAQPSSNTIFIVSTPYLINKAIQILSSLDTPTITPEALMDLPSSDMANNNFYVYKLRYHDGHEVTDALRDIGYNLERTGLANMDLVNTINSMQWIRANNSIVFSGTDTAIDKVLTLIEQIDTAPKQVYIEVLIIDTTLSNSLDFGVQWVALANEQNKLAFASGLLDSPPSGAPTGSLGIQQNPLYGGARSALHNPPPDAARGGTPGTGGDIPLTTGFGFGIVGNIIRHHGKAFLTLGALVSALETESDTVVVLNPRIMSEDSKEANFFVGQNVPYQTTSTVVRDTGSVTQNIQYEDIGVQLRVTPIVTPGNVVTLQIDQSVSDVTQATVNVTNAGVNTVLLAPTTTKLLTTTRVHVPDGAFLVMSGHVRDQMLYTRSGIPCLGTLPLIGPAFSKTNESRTKRNLIVFIRPHVITTSQEAINFSNLEGYEYNWESNPCSIQVAPPERAPECQAYPPMKAY